jgi:hypothetical protein
MTQYNLKEGIKKFGDDGKAAVLTELQQLYDRNVMEPVGKYDLTAAERKGALHYLMFLKEKRDGLIKGRGCADGRSQRGHMTKQETSSPTVATEALILSCVIDAIEGRDVATCNIPGAFMQSDMKGKVVMKLKGMMAEAILKIDPKKYTKYVARENGKDVIYVILTKACTVPYRPLCSSGKIYPQNCSNGDSSSTHMTSVLRTRPSTANNAPSYGTWMISRSHT